VYASHIILRLVAADESRTLKSALLRQQKILVEKSHSIVCCSFVKRRIVATSSQSSWRAEWQVSLSCGSLSQVSTEWTDSIVPDHSELSSSPPGRRLSTHCSRRLVAVVVLNTIDQEAVPADHRRCDCCYRLLAVDCRCTFAAFLGTTCIVFIALLSVTLLVPLPRCMFYSILCDLNPLKT